MNARTICCFALACSLIVWPKVLGGSSGTSSNEAASAENGGYPSPPTDFLSFARLVRKEGYGPPVREEGKTPRTLDLLWAAAVAEASFETAVDDVARTYALDRGLATALAEATIAAWPVSETYTWPGTRHVARAADAAERLRGVAALAPDHWSLQLDVARTLSKIAAKLAIENSIIVDVVLHSAEPIRLALALYDDFLNPMELYGRLLEVEPDHPSLHVARAFRAHSDMDRVALTERAIDALVRRPAEDEHAANAAILMTQRAFKVLFRAGLSEQAIAVFDRLPERLRARAVGYGSPEDLVPIETGEGTYVPPGVSASLTDLRDELAVAYVLVGRKPEARALWRSAGETLSALIAEIEAAPQAYDDKYDEYKYFYAKYDATELDLRLELVRLLLEGNPRDLFGVFLRAETFDAFAASTSILLARIADAEGDRQAQRFFLLRAIENARPRSEPYRVDARDPRVTARFRALVERQRSVIAALEDEVMAMEPPSDRGGEAIGRLLTTPAAISVTPWATAPETVVPSEGELPYALPPGLWMPEGWPVGERWNVVTGNGGIDGGPHGLWLIESVDAGWGRPRLLGVPYRQPGRPLEAPSVADGRVDIALEAGRLSTTLADLDRDRDQDGWSDLVEELYYTDPMNADMDGDGIADPLDLMPQIPETAATPTNGDPLTALLEGIGLLRDGWQMLPIVVDSRAVLGSLRPKARLNFIEPREEILQRRLEGRALPALRIWWFLERDGTHGFVRWKDPSTCGTMGLLRTADGHWRTKNLSVIVDC